MKMDVWIYRLGPVREGAAEGGQLLGLLHLMQCPELQVLLPLEVATGVGDNPQVCYKVWGLRGEVG